MKKLSEEIMADIHARNCHSVTDTDGRCTCYIGRWHDNVALLEQVVEAAKRAIAIIYDIGYAAIPTAIDLEEAIDRLEDTNEPKR